MGARVLRPASQSSICKYEQLGQTNDRDDRVAAIDVQLRGRTATATSVHRMVQASRYRGGMGKLGRISKSLADGDLRGHL